MKLFFLAALSAAMLCTCCVCSIPADTTLTESASVPELPLEYAELTVINSTGETLQLVVDDQDTYEIITEITIKLTPGEHNFTIEDPSGDQLPRHETIEAGTGITWHIVRAPDQP